jgi:hypothetical protein
MIKFDDYLLKRNIEASISSMSSAISEAQGIPLEQAKQQIMQVIQNIPMDNLENATAKLTFIDQLMKQGVQALPELSQVYKQEYPKYQQMQKQSQPQQPGATNQPQAVQQQQANQNVKQ